MAVQQVEDPETVEAVATKVDEAWIVDVVVNGRLLAVRVDSLGGVDAVVNVALQRRSRSRRPVRVHVQVYT